MTVAELMAALDKFPRDMNVVVYNIEDQSYYDLRDAPEEAEFLSDGHGYIDTAWADKPLHPNHAHLGCLPRIKAVAIG